MNPSDWREKFEKWIGSRVHVILPGGEIAAGLLMDFDGGLRLRSLDGKGVRRVPFDQVRKVWLLIHGEEP